MVSRSGATWSPQIRASSPVLTMTLRSRGSTRVTSPRSSLAAPVPPARATSFTGPSLAALPSGAGAYARGGIATRCAPQRRPAAPAIETDAGTPAKTLRQLGLGNRDEAVANPDLVEPLGSREHGIDTVLLRVTEGVREKLRGDLEGRLGRGVGRCHHHGAVQHRARTVAFTEQGPADTLAVPAYPPRSDLFGGRGGRARKTEQLQGVSPRSRQRAVRDLGRRATSCQAPRPSATSPGGTSRRAWPGS